MSQATAWIFLFLPLMWQTWEPVVGGKFTAVGHFERTEVTLTLDASPPFCNGNVTALQLQLTNVNGLFSLLKGARVYKNRRCLTLPAP